MEIPILYYWGPCATCARVTAHADELGVVLDKRDVAEEVPYMELLGLGGDANLIPYLYLFSTQELFQGVAQCNAVLDRLVDAGSVSESGFDADFEDSCEECADSVTWRPEIAQFIWKGFSFGSDAEIEVADDGFDGFDNHCYSVFVYGSDEEHLEAYKELARSNGFVEHDENRYEAFIDGKLNTIDFTESFVEGTIRLSFSIGS